MFFNATFIFIAVYLDMGAAGTSPSTKAYIEFKLDSTNWASYARLVTCHCVQTCHNILCRTWNIMASQVECTKNYHAPQVCNTPQYSHF